jgi:SpoIVB peptidase S55
MKGRRSPRAWLLKILSLTLGVGLFSGLMPSAVTAQVAGPIDCPEVMGVSEVTTGTMATGYTVSRGTAPESFDAEILGVLPDGVAPGRDMIVVETSGPAIEKAGGIWFGMSGSPVYSPDGRLIGAIAFGLSFGPSAIGGVTPAEDMAKLFDYPTGSDPAARAVTSAERVKLSERMISRIAEATGTSERGVGNSLVRLKTPLSVSGVARGLGLARKIFKARGVQVVPHSGSSASASAAPTAVPTAAGNFAAVLSYGDVTFAGIGTTTMVCNEGALAFGHPFFWDGRTAIGANAATALTVVDDPVFGAYKLATVDAGTFGTLDQDRLAGIRTSLGAAPETVGVTSDVLNLDTGIRRPDGRTDIVGQEHVPFLSFYHLFANIDSVFDEIGRGSSALTWRVSGTREDGSSWVFERSNKFISRNDISFGSLFELNGNLTALKRNGFEKVDFTGIDVDVEVEESIRKYTVGKVVVSRNGGRFEKVKRLNVRRRDRLDFRIRLRASDAAPNRIVEHTVRIPEKARRDGSVRIGGPSFDDQAYHCLIHPWHSFCKGDDADSFDELIESLEKAPRNTDLTTLLSLGGRRGANADRDVTRVSKVVGGSQRIRLNLRRGGPAESPDGGESS